MIYVDKLRDNPTISFVFPYKKFCHMISDKDKNELIEFGVKIGLNPKWIHNGYIPHFDLSPNKRRQAIEAGAEEIKKVDKKFLKIAQEYRESIK